MQVSRDSFRCVTEVDTEADLSWIGKYSDKPGVNAIDRQQRGDWRRGEYRYCNITLSPEETGNPESVEQDYKRLEAYNRGEWHTVGVKARTTLKIPTSQGGYILQTITSPGVWGVESDSDQEHFTELFRDECAVLEEMLKGLAGLEIVD